MVPMLSRYCCATDAFKTFAAQQYRQVVDTDATTAARHLFAPELTFETLLVDRTDAEAETARRLTLYGTERHVYRGKVMSQYDEGIDLGDAVTWDLSRFGMAGGKDLVVIGLIEVGPTTEMIVWG